jgi:alpha-L-rhamnosidase
MNPTEIRARVALSVEEGENVSMPASGVVLVDFGRVAFGNLELASSEDAVGVTVRFGEAFTGGRINREPPGSVRHAVATVSLRAGAPQVVAPAADERNTGPAAVQLPPEWGVVLPFRWVEIEGIPEGARLTTVRRRSAFARTWDDGAAAFQSSDELLNRVWELCRYSIKATTFAGVYVDGDRERIPYEADAYLNQLSHYAVDPDFWMARDTFDFLVRSPTWPTEWTSHMVFMAHADWMQTGDAHWLRARYESLKSKLLLERVRADGLVAGTPEQIKKDIVDWPPGERDDYVFMPVNTVVNAFYLRAISLMAELARASGKDGEAVIFESRFKTGSAAFQRTLFDPVGGLYRDGEGAEHSSLHANLFPLAFGLVPPEHRAGVVAFLKSKGMACSVYPAQYLLEGLFENGAANHALSLMTAAGDRSWRHMVESGTTITWEAWDQRYKPNQDWNHAWGAAPANILPRFVMGVQTLAPGWTRVRIRPFTGPLTSCAGKVPTPRGPVRVHWRSSDRFALTFELPAGMIATLELPVAGLGAVWVDGVNVEARRVVDRLHVAGEWVGRHEVEIR